MRYFDNGNGTVTDTETGLVWQQVASDKRMTWQEAQDYCAALNLAGHSDWRCPTIEELLGIHAHDPILKGAASGYWSASTYAGYPDYAWFVSTNNGVADNDGKALNYFVRAVRSGS